MPTRNLVPLRSTFEGKGHTVGWDSANNTASINNAPIDTTGWQNIDGRLYGTQDQYNTLNSNLGLPVGNVGQTPMTGGSSAPVTNMSAMQELPELTNFQQDINRLTGDLGTAVDNFSKPYDLASDPIYDQLSKYQESQMLQSLGARGMGMSDTAKGQIAQANTLLGSQFQDREMQRRQQEIGNMQNQLQMLTGLEDRQIQQDMSLYGMNLTPQTRQLNQIAQSITPQQRQQLMQYSDNFAAIMNTLEPSDPMYQQLDALRFEKVMSDPVQYKEFLINDYGLNPNQVNSLASRQEQEQVNAYLEQVKMQFENTKMGLELEKLQASVDKGQWDAVASQIRTSSLPEQIKADIQRTMAQTSSAYASATASQSSARLSDTRATQLEQDYAPEVPSLFADFTASNAKDFGTWLNSIATDNTGRPMINPSTGQPATIAEAMPRGTFNSLLDFARQSGKLSEDQVKGYTINIGSQER